jgi:formamidopyrimidine-DNA glycosylase
MPELPEVETIKKQLADLVVGEVVERVEVRREKSLRGDSRLIEGRKIIEITRVGKYLFFHTDKRTGIEGHLKMTGRMIVANGKEYETAKHTRVVMHFRGGKKLYFWDVRVFGYLEIVYDSRQQESKRTQKIGKEPWDLTHAEFLTLTQRYARPIKNLILDQALISGVGNIYANDALWKARIDPRRPANSLKMSEAKLLLLALREVLERGLATGGASDNSYVDALNKRGSYQDEFLVYRRTGEPCLVCQNKIARVVVGGRGSFYCPRCQK